MELNILIGVICLVVGFCIGFFAKKGETGRLEQEKKAFQDRVLELTESLSEKKAKLETLQNLQEILQKDLREQNREALEEKFKPLQKDFENFKTKIEEFNRQGEVKTAELKVQIENLVQESKNVQTTADKLANAIKDNAKSRGNFGELILENLLQQAGLINKREDAERGNYITQRKIYDDEAENKILPDAIVFFPDNKHIVIDSKCPLNNFQNYCNSDDEEEKEAELNKFFNEVEKMINELSGKYNKLEDYNTPEFKLMFLPLESCASYIYRQTDLLKKAAKKNIIIVCPSTLFATLKIINKVWQNKLQSENIKDIYNSFQKLYEKILIFVEKSKEIQKKIKEADNSFDELYKTADGRGGIFSQIEKLNSCGLISASRADTVKKCKNGENTED